MAEDLLGRVCKETAFLIQKKTEDITLIDIIDSTKLPSLLEVFITLELREKYEEWKYESLDGIYSGNISLEDSNQLNLVGMCILTSDQSVVPIYISIKVSDDFDEVLWIKGKIADSNSNGVIKFSYDSNRWRKQLYTIDVNKVNWFYTIEYEENKKESQP